MKLKKIIFIAIVISILYIILKPFLENLLLKYNGKCIKAELISDKVRVRYHKADLKYRFYFSGNYYEGNSLENNVNKVGDSVCVVFYKSAPSVNRPLKFFETPNKICTCN